MRFKLFCLTLTSLLLLVTGTILPGQKLSAGGTASTTVCQDQKYLNQVQEDLHTVLEVEKVVVSQFASLPVLKTAQEMEQLWILRHKYEDMTDTPADCETLRVDFIAVMGMLEDIYGVGSLSAANDPQNIDAYNKMITPVILRENDLQ